MGLTKRKNGKWVFRWTESGIRKTKYIGDDAALKKWKKEQDSRQDKPHVANNNGNNEWYTPPAYIEAARKVMGSIDIDPASSEKANSIVGALTFYTSNEDGRRKAWPGNIWMNPPYAQPLVSDFCDLLVKKFWAKEIKQACVLINNATETNFYQQLASCCSAICLIKGRVKFLDEDGNEGAPLQGQSLLYFGGNYVRFAQVFAQFGVVLYADKG